MKKTSGRFQNQRYFRNGLNNLLLLVRLIFNCTVLIWLSFYEIATRKKKQPETTMIQNIFPVPSVSVYNKWTPVKLKKNHTFLNGMFFFSFFSQEITKLGEYYTRFSFAKVDDQPVVFAAVIHLMSEKRAREIHVQAWGSLYHPTTKHKITLVPFNF